MGWRIIGTDRQIEWMDRKTDREIDKQADGDMYIGYLYIYIYDRHYIIYDLLGTLSVTDSGSQPHRPPRPVTGIVFYFYFNISFFFLSFLSLPSLFPFLNYVFLGAFPPVCEVFHSSPLFVHFFLHPILLFVHLHGVFFFVSDFVSVH
jgi:hypothetical protein